MKAGQLEAARDSFYSAEDIAREAGDEHKRLDALNPAAHALWLLGYYDIALDTLTGAEQLAERLFLIDERAIAISNMGRLATYKTLKLVPVADQPEALRQEAVPRFQKAREMLAGNAHFYYRYANAQYGAPTAALASERREALKLLRDGLSVAFRRSPEPYNYDPRTYKISPRGLGQMAVAAGLIIDPKDYHLNLKARTSLLR